MGEKSYVFIFEFFVVIFIVVFQVGGLFDFCGNL